MLLHIPNLLSTEQIDQTIAKIGRMQWQHGRDSAGLLSKIVKSNIQLSAQDPEFANVSANMREAICENLLFQSAAMPAQVIHPFFNCYEDGGHYGWHVDNARITDIVTGQNHRADLSITVFLSNPDSYDGGELVIRDHFGEHEVKLNAGDAILYPAGSLHQVLPVTRGRRLAACTWIQSQIHSHEHRQMLFDLDHSISALRVEGASVGSILKLTQLYHNLQRSFSD